MLLSKMSKKAQHAQGLTTMTQTNKFNDLEQSHCHRGHTHRNRFSCSYCDWVTSVVWLSLLLVFVALTTNVTAVQMRANIVTSSSNVNTPTEDANGAVTTNPNDFQMNRSIIVHLFEWKFVDIADECDKFLGPKGYAGVQLSPVTEHLIVRTEQLKRPWWERYQPISYKLMTRSGNEEEFLTMTRACNAVGVRIYVDVVLNHMAGYSTPNSNNNNNNSYFDNILLPSDTTLLNGTAGSVVNASSSLNYPDIPYTAKDFHKPCSLENYSDAYEIRNCQLNGHPDLDQSRTSVRTRIVEMLNHLVDLGVAGFRIDAAKYMWPGDLKNIFAAVKNLNSEEFDFPLNTRPLFFLDIVDLGIDSVSKTEYSGYGIVTEYLYAAELSTILRGKAPLSSLINWGPAMGFLPHQDALVFIDSHDGQRRPHMLGNNHLLTYKQPRLYVMANAFMLAHPYGNIKRIMSSFYYGDDVATTMADGPPTMIVNNADDADVAADSDDDIRSPEFDEQSQCTRESGWVCEHRWPAIVNMIALANALVDTEDMIINFQTDGPNHIAFCRGNKAFIAINNDLEYDYATEVYTCLQEGIYCDVISGGLLADGSDCHGKRIVVNAEGNADIFISSHEEENASAAAGAKDAVEIANNINEISDFGVIAIYVGSKLQSDSDMIENDIPVEKVNTDVEVGFDVEGEQIDNADADNADDKEIEDNDNEGNKELVGDDGDSVDGDIDKRR